MGNYCGTVDLPPEGSRPLRLDRYLCDKLEILTRSQLKNRIQEILVDGQSRKLSHILRGGETLQVEWAEAPETRVRPESLPLQILYEDQVCLVINKEAGMVVHPSNGHVGGTVVNAFMGYLADQGQDEMLEFPLDSQKGGDYSPEAHRPGLVHRLDKDTSGVMILAKKGDSLEYLAGQFRRRETEKRYLAVVRGQRVPARGEIEGFIHRHPHHRKKFHLQAEEPGKWSKSRYRRVKEWKGEGIWYSLVEFWIETGRTHQIRVHALSQGFPVLGDPLYSRRDSLFPEVPMLLHSRELKISLEQGKGLQSFKAPCPPPFGLFVRRAAEILPG